MRARERHALRSRPRCCSTPTAAASSFPTATVAPPPARPGDNAATAMKSVVVDPSAYDWEGDAPLRRPSAQTIIYEMHVRGFTRHPSSGVGERTARHLRRPDREDPVSPGARHHRGRAAAGVPVRRPGLPAGQGQLLGLRAGLVLRAAPGVQLAPGSARPGRRVPRHGQGAAPGRHRGHPRRRLQPHRRGRPARADALLPRPRQHRLLHPRGRTASRYANYTGYRQHAQRQPSDRPPDDRGQPALLGGGDARRRLPLRPRLDPGARRVGPAAAEPAGPVGHRVRPGARRHQAHRRGLGRGRPLPGRQLHRRQLEGVERPVPRRRPRLLPRRAGLGRRASPTGCSAAPRSTATRSARPSRASTSSPATTASPSTTSSPTTTSTTRRTARTTATAPTTTAAGTAASRGRPTTRRSSGCATGR